MQINDLLAPNETVRVKGTVTLYGQLQNITLTNKCIYFECGGVWNVIRYDGIQEMRLLHDDVGYNVLVSNYRIYFGENRAWAETVFRCIKNGWDESRQ